MSDIGLCDFSLPVPLLREREIKRDNLSPHPKGEWWREGLLLTFHSPFVFCPTALCAQIQTQKTFKSLVKQHFQKFSGGSFDRKLL